MKRQLFASPVLGRWNALLQHYHITTDSYTWETFCKKNAIYARSCPGKPQWYIGMTSVTLTSRELARKRKRNQISCHRLVSSEVAIRWWCATKSFDLFFPLVLSTHQCKWDCEIAEKTAIQVWQPLLNSPFIKSL